MNPATNEASLNLYALMSLYNNVGRVWKDSFLKKDIIVKSPKLNAEVKEKTKNMFFLISGNIIRINLSAKNRIIKLILTNNKNGEFSHKDAKFQW